MAMAKPIALNRSAFDSAINAIFEFTSNGGNQVVKNRLTIRNNKTNVVVYQNTVETFDFKQTAPSNTLTNGTYYNFYFNTYDIDNNESPNSNIVAFYCYEQPSLSITNMPTNNIVNSSNFNFVATYKQEQHELMDYMEFNLYDTNDNLISSSGRLTSNVVYPVTLSYNFGGFVNNSSYKIQVLAMSVNGTLSKTDLIEFSVVYIYQDIFNSLDLTNKCDLGFMQITSNIYVANGIPTPNPPIYLDGLDVDNVNDYIQWDKIFTIADTSNPVISVWCSPTEVDLHYSGSNIIWNEGFEIDKDFIITIWNTPALINDFCIIGTRENGIVVNWQRGMPYGGTKPQDFFEVRAYVNGVQKVYQKSNTVDILNNLSKAFIWIKKVGETWTLTLQVLHREQNIFNFNDGNSNVKYEMVTDIYWNGVETGKQLPQNIAYSDDIDSIFPLTDIRLDNGIFDNIDITKDTDKQYSINKPQWGYKTEFSCDFNGNLNGGNTDYIIRNISSIKVKRRKNGDYNWVTLYEIPIHTVEDFKLVKRDSFIPSGGEFEWAIVPCMNDGTEGTYVINSASTNFNGLFISDGDNIFKLYSGVIYNGNQSIQMNGMLQPIGSKYPVIIDNSDVDYETIIVQGNLYGYSFENTRRIDRKDATKQSQDFVDFLKNKKSKIITDWNGKILLGKLSGSVSINPDLINGYSVVSFTMIEQGKYDNQEDLYENGLTNVEK